MTVVLAAAFVASAIWISRSVLEYFESADSTEESESGESSEVESTAAEEVSELSRFLDSLPAATGGEPDTSTFDASIMSLSLENLEPFGLSGEFSLSEKTVTLPVRVPDEVFETYSTELRETQCARPQLELYMGYFIVDRGTYRELYSSDGTLIDGALEALPAYRRTADGSPLFYDGSSYYTVSDGGLSESDYSPETDRRAVYYEYPADFAADDGFSVTMDPESGLCALTDADGERLTGYDYTRIFAFSEGLAAALGEDGSLSYIDADGKIVIEGRETFRTESARYADRVYRLPDTLGRESKGFLYFDGSVVLARVQTVDIVYKENVMSDTTVALGVDGKVLGYPGDYTPISASDGAVVLERDGKYGVYASDDSWRLDPIYDLISPFYEGLAVVEKNGSFGVCSNDGELVIPLLFDYISDCSAGRIAAYSAETGFVLFEKCRLSEN